MHDLLSLELRTDKNYFVYYSFKFFIEIFSDVVFKSFKDIFFNEIFLDVVFRFLKEIFIEFFSSNLS